MPQRRDRRHQTDGKVRLGVFIVMRARLETHQRHRRRRIYLGEARQDDVLVNLRPMIAAELRDAQENGGTGFTPGPDISRVYPM